ncbi:MAG: hypothetical protein R3C41_06680 [Calditrichia bacterium]
MRFRLLIAMIVAGMCISVAAKEKPGKQSLQKGATIGLVDTMAINNIFLPYQNDGSTAENAQAYFPNPGIPVPLSYNQSFLYQGGIAATGYINGQLRASWMAKASLIQEFQPGKWGTNPDDSDARFYVVNKSDAPGSRAYIDWQKAVELGASFKDMDGDGVYDPNIDVPDILGDRTSWTVYNDGTDISVRTDGLQTQPLGLEVHQQVFAFARDNELGNVVFLRYRMINVTENDIDSLIFSIWTDPDIGEATDDLIGSDIDLSLGYCYNNGDDNDGTGPYGSNPPAFGVDFFQGPIVSSPGDTAYRFLGPQFGVDTIPDFRNLPLTSFTFYNNDPSGQTQFPSPGNNVVIARRYQVGGVDGNGNPINPELYGVGGTAGTAPQYFYSGDPATGEGWLDNTEADKRFMVNTGPFRLAASDTQDIVVAYVVGQLQQNGNSSANVAELKRIDATAQSIYDGNFFVAGPPPPPHVDVRTFDDRIELIIDLERNGTLYHDEIDGIDNRQMFEGINIYQFNSPQTTLRANNGQLNRQLLASFDVRNQYADILIQQTNERVRLYRGNNNLNLSAIGDSGGTVIRYVIDKDVFNEGQPLINNAEYYFSVTSFSINVNQLSPLENGAWIGSADPYLENPLGGAQLFSVIFNRDENRPFKGSTAEYIGTRTGLAGRDVFDGRVVFDVVDRDALTNDNYLVSFFNNGDFYSITNESQNRVLRDTLIQQDSLAGNSWTFPIIDGLSIRVKNVPDGINSVEETMPAGGVDWLDGAAILTSSTAAYNGGVDFIQNSFRSNLSPGLSREDYFPVRLVLGTTDDAFAQHFRANYNLSVGMKPTFLKAFDMTDPNSPRQLYVAYHNASPTGIVDFSSNNDIIIFKSDYAGDAARYGRASTDTLFRDEAYLVAQFVAVDSILQANEMTLDITPYYPNSNVDEYRVHTEDVQPLVTAAERKDQLEMVNVVPNPYWAYSAYETSYDTPVIKFTHLPNEVTIRIFNLAGQLIKTLSKNNVANELTWNLRNESNLRVASGMYLAHVEAPEIGEKILKFAIIQREERLDRF